jgi:hypothetical protein
MNQLHVSIDSPDGQAVGWRVPATIRAIDGDIVQNILVTTGTTPVAVSLSPGSYIVEAYLPSGEMLRRSAAISPGQDATVRLLMAPSPHEWLATSARMTNANRYRTTDQLFTSPTTAAGADFVPNPFIALQGWLEQPRSTFGAMPSVSDNALARFDFSSASFRVGPPPLGVPPSMNGFVFTALKDALLSAVALPLGWMNANLTESAYEIVFNKSTGTTTVIVQDPDFAPVLGYLADGQTTLASRALNEQAVELLANKLQNPFGAAAGGYVLLQRALQNSADNDTSWRSWIRNLTQWFPLLPDGFVIRGTLLLHNLRTYGDPDIDSSQAAKECFLRSVQLGVPLFSIGVRLLLDGLLALGGVAGAPDPNLTWVRRLSMFVDPREAFTTLRIGQTG